MFVLYIIVKICENSHIYSFKCLGVMLLLVSAWATILYGWVYLSINEMEDTERCDCWCLHEHTAASSAGIRKRKRERERREKTQQIKICIRIRHQNWSMVNQMSSMFPTAIEEFMACSEEEHSLFTCSLEMVINFHPQSLPFCPFLSFLFLPQCFI